MSIPGINFNRSTQNSNEFIIELTKEEKLIVKLRYNMSVPPSQREWEGTTFAMRTHDNKKKSFFLPVMNALKK